MPFSTDQLTSTLAVVGVVVLVAALLSGLVDRSGLPQVAVFLALGAALGPAGLGVLDVDLQSPALRVVATLSLALVLFTDAVLIDVNDIRRHRGLALRVLGPGTLLSAALIALAGWWLLGLHPAAAAILGAALASTDPVLLRGLLRRRALPPGARHALRLESGLNDGVLLPIVLVGLALLRQDQPLDSRLLARLGLDLLLLGPGAGVGVGLIAVAALDLVRRRLGVRRDYEALYSLGIALAAYAAAEAVHGSGFVAAFVAGLTISALDVELCDCFLEYGETTAEMLLIFAFVLFGGSLIWSGFSVLTFQTLAFAAIALLIRPAVFVASLAGSGLDRRGIALVSWFGPRGLSSLLLVLLPLFAGVAGTEPLFALCSLVVLLSVLLHGMAPMLPFWSARPTTQSPPTQSPPTQPPVDAEPAIAAPPVGPVEPETEDEVRLTTLDVQRLLQSGDPVAILDVRTERTYARDPRRALGAIRLPPDHVAERAAELQLDRLAWLVAYCA